MKIISTSRTVTVRIAKNAAVWSVYGGVPLKRYIAAIGREPQHAISIASTSATTDDRLRVTIR
jgi:hypothetical protein